MIANQISFLETTDLIHKSKPVEISPENEPSQEKMEEIWANLLPDSEEEQLKNSFFPDNSFQEEKEENEEKKEVPAEIKILADTTKYMSLNDKFRFQREIFMGSAEEMNKVFDTLNEFSTIEDTWSFIKNQSWYNDSEIIAEFIELIEKRFS